MPHFKVRMFYVFFGPGSELHIYHWNTLLMDNKHGKLIVIKQSKWCRFMPKMHQNMFGGRTLPGPAGELIRSSRPPSRNEEPRPTSKGREGKGRGPTLKGTEVKEGRRECTEREEKGIPSAPPKSNVSRINTVYSQPELCGLS